MDKLNTRHTDLYSPLKFKAKTRIENLNTISKEKDRQLQL